MEVEIKEELQDKKNEEVEKIEEEAEDKKEEEIEKSKKKARSSNFEILRIISMLLIIVFHACYNCGGNIIEKKLTTNTLIACSFGIWGLLGVDAFVFISAYFLVDSKKFRFEKILKIILETVFYALLTLFAYHKIQNTVINSQSIFNACVSFAKEYWFITAYIMLYLVHPFLNRALEKVDMKYLKRFLIVCAFIFPLNYSFFYASAVSGYDLFFFMYCLMYYLKHTENNFFERHRNIGFILLTLFIFIGTIILNKVILKYNLEFFKGYIRFFCDRPSIFIMFDAAFLFYIFKNWNIGSHKFINEIAASTLGVYILHESDLTKAFIWSKFFKLDDFLLRRSFTIRLVIDVFLVFAVATIIDFIRRKTVEKIIFNKYNVPLNKLEEKIDAFYK